MICGAVRKADVLDKLSLSYLVVGFLLIFFGQFLQLHDAGRELHNGWASAVLLARKQNLC